MSSTQAESPSKGKGEANGSNALANPDSPDSPDEKKSGRRKITIEFIEDKSRRHITFSKRKAGIMKKAYELSTLTGTQVLLLVASETGHVYTFATPKLQPLITKPEGKNLIQACLNTPDNSNNNSNSNSSQPALPPALPRPSSFPEANPYQDADNYDDDKKAAESKAFPAALAGLDMSQFPGYNPHLLQGAAGRGPGNPQYPGMPPMGGGLPQGYPPLMRPPNQAYPQYPPAGYSQLPNQHLPVQQAQQGYPYWSKGPSPAAAAAGPMSLPFLPPSQSNQGPGKG